MKRPLCFQQASCPQARLWTSSGRAGLVMLSFEPLSLLKSDWATAEQRRAPAGLYMGSDLEPDLVRRRMDEGTYGFTCLM